jgi:uncharacterized tellurite resistance protein B-like protein
MIPDLEREFVMASDFKTFFDIYARPPDGGIIRRGSYEFRYAAAALLVACSKADRDEDSEEQRVITDIIRETFQLAPATLESLLQMADDASEKNNLTAITDLVNEYYGNDDKLALLECLWHVAYADGRIDRYEELFIQRIAAMIQMTNDDVSGARRTSKPE